MKIALLEHAHKFGMDNYLSVVGDLATMDDVNEIIAAMIAQHDIDYTPPKTEEEEAIESVELRLIDMVDVPVVHIGFTEDKGQISDGVWRYSKEAGEVTTSIVGVLEGSKRICRVSNQLKSEAEVDANGDAIAAVPFMIRALKDTRLFLGNHDEISKTQLKALVNKALDRVKN